MLARALIPFTPLALATAALAQCPQLSVVPGCGYNGVYPSAERMILWDPDGPGPRSEVVLISGVEIAGERACNGFATWDGTNLEPLPGTWTEKSRDVVLWNGRPLAATVAQGTFHTTSLGGRSGIFVYEAGEWQRVGPESFDPTDASVAVFEGQPIAAAYFGDGSVTEGTYSFADGIWTRLAGAAGNSVGRLAGGPGFVYLWDSCCVSTLDAGNWRLLRDSFHPFQGASVGPNSVTLFTAGSATGQNSSAVFQGSGQDLTFVTGLTSSGWRVTGATDTPQGIVLSWGFGSSRAPSAANWPRLGFAWDAPENSVRAEGAVRSSLEFQGRTFIGGTLRSIGDQSISGIAEHSAGAWLPLMPGLSGNVLSTCRFEGDRIALVSRAGTNINGTEIFRLTNGVWHRIGERLGGVPEYPTTPVRSVFVHAGSLYASGSETYRFDGTAWMQVSATGAIVGASMGTLGQESLFQCGSSLQAFNGTSFRYLLGAGNWPYDNSLVRFQDTYAGAAGNVVSIYRNGGWIQLGGSFDARVFAVAESHGDLFAFGRFAANAGVQMPRIARWDGTAWNPVPLGDIPIQTMYPYNAASVNGRVCVLATFDETQAADRLVLYEVDRFGCREAARVSNAPSLTTLFVEDDAIYILREGLKDGRGGGGWLLRYGPGPNPCPADLDCTGGIDGDDIIAFFAAWESGATSADMNGDGEVDGDDVTGFFERWDVGC